MSLSTEDKIAVANSLKAKLQAAERATAMDLYERELLAAVSLPVIPDKIAALDSEITAMEASLVEPVPDPKTPPAA